MFYFSYCWIVLNFLLLCHILHVISLSCMKDTHIWCIHTQESHSHGIHTSSSAAPETLYLSAWFTPQTQRPPAHLHLPEVLQTHAECLNAHCKSERDSACWFHFQVIMDVIMCGILRLIQNTAFGKMYLLVQKTLITTWNDLASLYLRKNLNNI